MAAHYPEKAATFKYTNDMLFYRSMGDVKNYLKASGDYVKKEVKNNAKQLNLSLIHI